MKKRLCLYIFIIICTLLFTTIHAEAALQCYDCHGTSLPVDYRPIDASFRNPSSGGVVGNHRTHLDSTVSASACDICHPGSSGYNASHRDGLIKVSASINGSPLTTTYKNSTTAWAQSATPAMGTCSNVNCHFETVTPAWGNDPAATTCDSCHGAPPSGNSGNAYAGGAAGSHAKHDLYYPGSGNCRKCHPDNSTFKHATSGGKRNLAISFAAVPNNGSGAYSGPLNDYLPRQTNLFGNCTATYCHSPGNKGTNFNSPVQTATWGGTLGCGGCHAATPATGSHNQHVATTYGVPIACHKCHASTVAAGMTISSTANHVNKLVNIAFNSTTTATFGKYSGIFAPMQKNPGSGYGKCENVYCHSSGQGAGGSWPPVYSAPKWGNTETGKCGSCHDHGYHSGVTKINTGSHDKHMSYAFTTGDIYYRSNVCVICHYGGGTTDPFCTQCHFGADNLTTKHVDHKVDVSFISKFGGTYNGTPQPGDGYSTCSNGYCHSSGVSVSTGSIPANTSAAWGSGLLSCNSCHGNPPSYTNNSPKKNSHVIHGAYGCNKCHYRTTGNGTAIASTSYHVNKVYDVYSGAGARFTYSYNASGGACNSISCHGNTSAQWGSPACLGCHSVAQGSRAAISSQFGASSHHVQGTISDAHCYQCHWEAYSDGTINPIYHGGTAAPGAAVDLVVYGAGVRPSSYSLSGTATATQYTANGTRGEITKINSHCLGCHSDQNNTAQPFGDGKTPRQYAWDGTSIAARYSQGGTTSWGKYSTVTNAAHKSAAKSLSAHGNAAANKRGWSISTGLDGAIADTSGAINVLCFDCHNSHGSTASGVTSRYASATTNGGILKDTIAGQGGYSIAYKPYSAGSAATRNKRSAGASLCLDCHMNPSAAQTPWGYTSTYGATQQIIGYWDSPFMSYSTCGPEQRYPYKKKNGINGGHFGASMTMTSTPTATIGGLCTPCHDPHGVSPTLGADQQYAVPLLKGTWLTSPYKEDVAPANNAWLTNFGGYGEGVQYHIDQNTFGSNIRGSVAGITQTVEQSSGLCLGCHPKSSLTTVTTSASPNPWKGKDRIHESVKGWKSSNGTVEHNYSCSKCHSAHTSSVLPRLMVTNCLDSRHKGRTEFNFAPVISGSSNGDGGSGSGHIPGSYSGGGFEDFGDGIGLPPPGNVSVTCHDSAKANGFGTSGTNQEWNLVTPWAMGYPTMTSPTAAAIGTTTATLGANITSNGGAGITSRGTVWGLWPTPSPTGNALAEGGTTTGIYSHARTGLPAGTKIIYRGYATNSSGTVYSPDAYFYTEPSNQASAVNFTSITTTSIRVNWIRGNGDGVIVLMRQGSAVNSNPADGTYSEYSANAVFGNGSQVGTDNYIVYKGTGTGATITGLTGGTTYYVAVYEYKGTENASLLNQGCNYKPSPATGNQATSPSVPVLASPAATAIASISATLGANVTSNGGSALTARGTVWGTSASPTGNVVAEGGTATGIFSHARTGLTAGTKIYYRGYATSSAGTGYSPDGSFYTEPATQASGVNFTSAGTTSMTVNWIRGSGDAVIVLMKQGSAVDSGPADGIYTSYIASTVFGNGTQIGTGNNVVYRGSGTGATITGLTAGTSYYVAVYEYKGTVDTSGVNQGTNYKQTPATGLQSTNSLVPILVSPSATSIGSATATLGANVTSNNGLPLTARGTAWGASPNPTGNAVAEGGTATGIFSHARTGLTGGTKIYYRGYATNSAGTGYSPDGSFYTEPVTQASGVTFTSVTSTGMTVNWTRGNGDGVIVLMRTGSAVNSDPVDGIYTAYTANSVFGSGTQIGTGNYVVYRGSGASAAICGLTAGATYYVAVYEYKGTADTSGVDQGTNYKPVAATGNQTTTPGGGTNTFIFNYTGGVQFLAIPAGATNIQFTVKGAGGAGGRSDDFTGDSGLNGHSVITSYGTSGVSLHIYVGSGGQLNDLSFVGADSVFGYHSGGAGGNGDYANEDEYGFGGSSGGGSSAVTLSGGALLAEAMGGAGGKSSDWSGYAGGTGGLGGGAADFPATTSLTGGGAGGGADTPGVNGEVIITYEY